MSLYLTIDHSEYVMPDSSPIASMLKHLSNCHKVELQELGDDHVWVIGDKVRVSLSTQHAYKQIISKTEYHKRVLALRRALPANAGPDAHGKHITKRER